MLRNKDITIISEVKDFFTSSEKAINTILTVLSSLTLSEKRFGIGSKCNNRVANINKILLLILFPFFDIKAPYNFKQTPLYPAFRCGKDLFYRMLNDFNISWRGLSSKLTKQIIQKAGQNGDNGQGQTPRCVIVDDTDLPKTGRHIELIGKVFSHVSRRSILAFKGLFLCYHDGKSLFAVDFSLHGEKGKNKKKPYGLSPTQLKKRYNKRRVKGTPGQQRKEEYFTTKVQSMLSMLRTAISNGLRFDYLLVDSWFTCFELVRFIKTRRIGCHLIGMAKTGKTKYTFNQKRLSAKEIADYLRRAKKTKRLRRLNFYYCETEVEFNGIPVKLFFCKTSHKGKWNLLLTTNPALTFEGAYKIYSIRWSIEVFFKESKQHLGLGKCQSQDFDAQIAHTTICMLQYNLLSLARRFTHYESLGELFRNTISETIYLTVYERIWQIITVLLVDIAEIIEIDPDSLMEKLISDNENIKKLTNYRTLMQAG